MNAIYNLDLVSLSHFVHIQHEIVFSSPRVHFTNHGNSKFGTIICIFPISSLSLNPCATHFSNTATNNEDSPSGTLYFQKAYFTRAQLKNLKQYYDRHCNKEGPNDVRNVAGYVLFGDNDEDKARDPSRPRQGTGGQAQFISEYVGIPPYDRTIAIGIETAFWTLERYNKKWPDLEPFKALMNKRFDSVQRLLQNGSDIIVPSPNNDDLTGRNGHKYVNKNGAQVIYHNLGTGIADLPFKYLQYIQSKVDELSQYARRTVEIQSPKMYKGYGQMANSGRSPSILQPQQQSSHRRAAMQTSYPNNDPRTPPRTPQRNPRTTTPVQRVYDRNYRTSPSGPSQIYTIGYGQNRNDNIRTPTQRKVQQRMRTPEQLSKRFNHETQHLKSPYSSPNRQSPYSKDALSYRSPSTSRSGESPYYSPQRGVWDIPQERQKRNGIVDDAVEFIMNLICFFPLSLYNTMLVQYSPRDACKVLCVLFFIIAFVCFVISWDLTTGGIIWMFCGVVAAILGSDRLNI